MVEARHSKNGPPASKKRPYLMCCPKLAGFSSGFKEVVMVLKASKD